MKTIRFLLLLAFLTLLSLSVNADELVLHTPNGGENIASGSTYQITWESIGSIDNIKIEYSINNGKKWIDIVKREKVTAPVQSYLWRVPCTPTSKVKVRLSDAYGSASAVSFKAFTVRCHKEKTPAGINSGSN